MSAAAAATTRPPRTRAPPGSGKTSMLLSQQQPTPPAAPAARLDYFVAEKMVLGFLVVFLLCRALFDLPFALVVSGTVPFLVLINAKKA